jgi:hypothetical protein
MDEMASFFAFSFLFFFLLLIGSICLIFTTMQEAKSFHATLLLCYIWLFPRWYIILVVISLAK